AAARTLVRPRSLQAVVLRPRSPRRWSRPALVRRPASGALEADPHWTDVAGAGIPEQHGLVSGLGASAAAAPRETVSHSGRSQKNLPRVRQRTGGDSEPDTLATAADLRRHHPLRAARA